MEFACFVCCVLKGFFRRGWAGGRVGGWVMGGAVEAVGKGGREGGGDCEEEGALMRVP